MNEWPELEDRIEKNRLQLRQSERMKGKIVEILKNALNKEK